MKIVVDTSAFAQALFNNIDPSNVEKMHALIQKADEREYQLIAPELLVLEMNSVVVKSDLASKIKADLLEIFYDLLGDDIVKIYSHNRKLYQQAYDMASNHDPQNGGYISIYDATFHALAILENATFLTADKKHYHKTKDSIGHIVLLEYFTVN